MESTDNEKTRFQLELEFIQCLSNPWYLNFLAQQGYFDDPAFINYLKYLQYWKKPEYAKFIIYPHCLHFLELLQSSNFRNSMAKIENATFVHEKQYFHWQFYRNKFPNIKVPGDPTEERKVSAAGLNQSEGAKETTGASKGGKKKEKGKQQDLKRS